MFLGESWQKGLLLQYGGQANRVSRVVLTGTELLRTNAAIEPDHWRTVCWRITPDTITLTVDEVELLHLALTGHPLAEHAHPVGLMLHNPARLRMARVEAYDPLACAQPHLARLADKRPLLANAITRWSAAGATGASDSSCRE
jgi:hypothetical protein